jgi:Gluconate 2-dehydrogenase subunit 3
VIPSARNLEVEILVEQDSALKISGGTGAGERRWTRREMVCALLAGAAAPLVSAAHPIQRHFGNEELLDGSDEKLAAENWTPVFLSAEQNELLVSIAEAIVPGSTAAVANRFIDLLLSVDEKQNQKKFLVSLGVIEKESQGRFGRRFPSLSTSQKEELLDAVSKGYDGKTGSSDDEKSSKEPATSHEHFELLKGWIAGAYYSSELGMKELGWTPDRVFASYPGCEHAEEHY